MSTSYAAGPLLTFGHGTATRQQLADLLVGAGVGLVVDVRRFPGSRRHPHVATDELARWLPDAGVSYRWDPRLGGRRRPSPPVVDTWWQVEAFAAYAQHMRTPEFLTAVDDLLAGVAGATVTADGSQAAAAGPVSDRPATAVMCSETVWWRCHRRLVADHLVLVRGVEVAHLGHDGRLSPHRPAEGARVVDGGLLYDAR